MQRTEVNRSTLALLSLVGLWIALLLSGGPVQAAQGTAATPAADCTGIDAYTQELRQIRDDYRAGFIEQLPAAPRPWEISPTPDASSGLDGSAMAWMNWAMWVGLAGDAETAILADLWSQATERLRALEPPPIAKEFHEELVTAAESWVDVYQEEGAMVGLAVMMMPGVGTDPSTAAFSEELTASCPVWAAYQAESFSLATPVPS